MRLHPMMAVAMLGTLLGACGGNEESQGSRDEGGSGRYDVTVTRTQFGIPHIRGENFGSVGYGYGYAFAEDNLCALMEDLVTIRGERAKYFGRNGPTYTLQATGVTESNVNSDFFWKMMATPEAIAPFKARSTPEATALTTGYKDGFNRYIRELKAGRHPERHAACANAPWLAEISEDDMYRRYFRLALLASSSVFLPGIATAQPPGSSSGSRSSSRSSVPPADLSPAGLQALDRSQIPFANELNIGSNMYAIGPDATANGGNLQFVNPHFPWMGTERLYMAHLTIPGKMDIMGTSLYGSPVVNIGFNERLAWSHTVSTAYRFTLYELTLVPGSPTSYLYEGQAVKMTPVPLTIEVTEDDGSRRTESRTLYRSKYGPMMGLKVRQGGQDVDILPWTQAKAYTLRDANAENDRMIDQFLAWNTARDLTEFKRKHKEILGVPWVNTTATGPGESAYYGDVTVVPNVPDAKVQQCSTSVQAQALAQLVPGLPLLDGSRAACEWGTDPDAPAPGIFGPSKLPTLERRDWVANANDSHWLTNPAQLLEGYPRIIGAERTVRSLRTRHTLLKMQRRADGSDGKPGTHWTPELLKESVLDAHIYSGELARDAVVKDICPAGSVLTTKGLASIGGACAALGQWDLSNNRDAIGAHVWREFWRKASATPGFYRTGFSVADPVNTPRDINTASPLVRSALGETVQLFESLGLPLESRLGSIQRRGDIEIFGGEGNMEGAFAIARGPLSKSGYEVGFGNSHVSVITWNERGPVADAFITYSQSTDPASPHHADFTREYSAKRWHRLPFRADEVEGAAVHRLRLHD